MQKHLIDTKKSEQVLITASAEMAVRRSYLNVFRLGYQMPVKFTHCHWKVAYGYIEIPEWAGILIRHCYILDAKNQKVIDPTAAMWVAEGYLSYPTVYHTMYTFESLRDYIRAIDFDASNPALERFLADYDRVAATWARENGFLFKGPDFM